MFWGRNLSLLQRRTSWQFSRVIMWLTVQQRHLSLIFPFSLCEKLAGEFSLLLISSLIGIAWLLQNNGFFTLSLPLSETGDDCTAKKDKNTNKEWWYIIYRNCKNCRFFERFFSPLRVAFFFAFVCSVLAFCIFSPPLRVCSDPKPPRSSRFQRDAVMWIRLVCLFCDLLCLWCGFCLVCVPVGQCLPTRHGKRKMFYPSTPLVYGWVSECWLEGVKWR